jgi:tetratricopeptide (TPR) repeat protein
VVARANAEGVEQRCPDPDVLVAFAEGRLCPEDRGPIEEHLDRCAQCEEMAAELARVYAESASDQPSTQPVAPPAASLQPGTRLHRYHVLEPVGAGAMGVVYAAYDPDLDRKIALKVLRSRGASRVALLREAQALARLSHRNVIAVHEAGESEGRVFIAMEFVDGDTLRGWLAAEPRSWIEIHEVFLAVAQGLAAAHDAGLVHRDVKPDNVLVERDRSGADAIGRVLVTDFGLARAAAHLDPLPDGQEVSAPLLARRTRRGVLVGTPAYMAPEQLAGEPADALSDQFAYCVALFEALYGERPFAGSSVAAIALAIEAGQVREPTHARAVPRWLHQVVLRGLSADPSARFGSLRELVRALQRGRGRIRRRRQGLALLGALAVGGGIAWGAATLSQRACQGADEKIDGIWNRSRRAAAKQVLLAVDAPYAEDTWRRAEVALDHYARAWTQMHVEACLATAVHKEQSEQLLDARMRCLDRRRRALAGLIEAILEVDRETLAQVSRSIDALPSIEPCSDPDALLAAVAPPDDPATRARIAAIREELTDVTRLQVAGRYDEAVAHLQALRDQAADVDHRPFQAELLFELGSRQSEAGAKAEAEATLSEAVWLARASGADDIVRDASIRLVEVSRAAAGTPEPGLQWARRAWAEVERSGLGGHDEASLRIAEAIVLRHAARYDEARETLLRGLALLEREFGPEHPRVANALGQLGPIEQELGQFDAAQATLRRSVQIYETTYGPRHPDTGYALSNLARVQFAIADYEGSLQTRLRALEILEGSLASDHPHLATSHGSLGNVLQALGRPEEAIEHLRRAVEIDESRYGPDHAEVAADLHNLSIAELALGRHDDALAHAKRAVDTLDRPGGGPPSHPRLGDILAGYADTLQVVGRNEESLEVGRRTIEVQREIYGDDRPEVGIAMLNFGSTLAIMERWEEARAPIEEGVAMLERHLGPEHEYVSTGLDTLATVLEELGEHVPALELTTRALAIREATFGPNHRSVGVTLHNLGAAYERRGNDEAALAHYERARAVFEALESPPTTSAETNLALARVVWRTGGDRERARRLAREAHEQFAARPDSLAADGLAEAAAWLAAH